MKFDGRTMKILGLNAKERRVLNALNEKNSANISDLAGKIDLARTTVAYILNQLKKRGLVERVKTRNHFEWRLADTAGLRKHFRELAVSAEEKSGEVGAVFSSGLDVEIYKGKKKIKELYKRILSEVARGSRYFAIQGNRSVTAQFSKLEEKFINDLHAKIKEMGLVVEGAIGESSYDFFKGMAKERLMSHWGRAVVAYVVPDKFMDFNLDIYVFNRSVYFVNMVEEEAVIINNAPMVGALKKLLDFLEFHGRKTDLNAYIAGILKEQEK